MDKASSNLLLRLYRRCPLSVDQLPYTTEFEKLYKAFRDNSGKELTRPEFYRALTNLRKKGVLARKGRQKV